MQTASAGAVCWWTQQSLNWCFSGWTNLSFLLPEDFLVSFFECIWIWSLSGGNLRVDTTKFELVF